MHINLEKVQKVLKFTDEMSFNFVLTRSSAIARHFTKYAFNKAVIGLSGGLDSAVSAALAVKALGPENVIAYSLPYNSVNKESSLVAKEVAKALGIELRTVSIYSIVDSLLHAMVEDSFMNTTELATGNACARARMMVLMHAATMEHALLLGTENRTEEMLAYYTIGGDDTTHVEPIHDLFKVQVFQIGEYLKLPESVLNRAPSAELWEGQTDENELGMSYEEIDDILYHYSCHFPMQQTENVKKILARLSKVAGKVTCPTKL